MAVAEDYRGVAKVFWSGRSQAIRLPAACRFDVSEVEIVKNTLTLRPRGKNETLASDGTPIGAKDLGSMDSKLDLLIAAHARSLSAVLVTNNQEEFGRVPGLKTEGWLVGQAGQAG